MSEEDTGRMIMSPLGCTNCQQWVRVRISDQATGNLTIVCPDCKHEHYRYVENGVITQDRWKSSARTIVSSANWFTTGSVTYGSMSMPMNTGSTTTATSNTSASVFLQQSWNDSSTTY